MISLCSIRVLEGGFCGLYQVLIAESTSIHALTRVRFIILYVWVAKQTKPVSFGVLTLLKICPDVYSSSHGHAFGVLCTGLVSIKT